MPISYQNIVDRSEILAAGTGGDASASPLVDSEITAALLVPHVFRYIARKRLADGKVEDVLADFDISLDADGLGELPKGVIRESLQNHAYLPDYSMASWVSFPDFGRYKYSAANQLQYFTSKGDAFYCAPLASLTITLRAPAVPQITDADTDLQISDTFAEDVIGCIASVLRGEIPITVIIDGYIPLLRRR